MENVVHPIDPVFDEKSRILILGSFPSVKSREVHFYYGHPQNRFWKVLASLFHEEIPADNKGKKDFLLAHHIALWDVIHSCKITGSSDASIKDVTANNLKVILDKAAIQKIYVNGKTAEKLYRKYIEHELHRDCVCLPSTSPANAVYSLERLLSEWKKIKEALEVL